MSQQINLFNPILLKQKKYFSALTMAQALGLLLAGSLLLAVYTHYQLSRLGTAVTVNSARLEVAKQQLGTISGLYGDKENSQLMEIRKTEAELQSLQQIFDILQTGKLGSTQGYAEYMRAFSRQIIGGLWLTGFSIHGAGSDIELQGRTVQPALVPAYLRRLKHEPVLQGKSFARINMQVPGQKLAALAGSATSSQPVVAAYIDFSLQSSGIASADAAEEDAE